MPPQPCKGCRFADQCEISGLVNRIALTNWIEELGGIECPDYSPDYFHGIEGVFS